MNKRKDYYSYQREHKDTPFESDKKYDHDGATIKVKDLEQLESLAMDYICTKRAGTYFEAFEYILKVIDVVKKQQQALDQVTKNYTV